jgi:hypothetical protein
MLSSDPTKTVSAEYSVKANIRHALPKMKKSFLVTFFCFSLNLEYSNQVIQVIQNLNCFSLGGSSHYCCKVQS